MVEALLQGGAFFLWLKSPFYGNNLKFFQKFRICYIKWPIFSNLRHLHSLILWKIKVEIPL